MLGLGVRDPNVGAQMHVLGFSLDCLRTKNKFGAVCKFALEDGSAPFHVRLPGAVASVASISSAS